MSSSTPKESIQGTSRSKTSSKTVSQSKETSYDTINNTPHTSYETSNLDQLDKQNKLARNSNYTFESNKKYFTICIYALAVITLAAFIIFAIVNLQQTTAAIRRFFSILSPFLVAFFIAYILNPVVVSVNRFLHQLLRIKNQKVTGGIAIAFTYLLFLSLITVTLFYIIPELGDSINELTNTVNPLIRKFTVWCENLKLEYPDLEFLGDLEDKLTQALASALSYLTNFVANLLPTLINISISIVKVVINLFLSIVISIYMLNDKKMISTNIKRLLYAYFKQDSVTDFIITTKECSSIYSSFVIGKTIDSLIIGLICFILMTILRLPYSVLLSIIVAITNMIPYFGPFIGAVPGVLLYLIIDPIKALIFCIMILALQQFDGLYLGPKILGNSTGLKPIWVIFAITVGGAYAGALGMFLGVPTVGAIAYLLNKSISKHLARKNIKKELYEDSI